MTSFYGGSGGSIFEPKPQPGAMIFKGMIGSIENGATVTTLPDNHTAGWTYLVVTASTYAGEFCEIGDFIICITDGTIASDLDWKIIQGNIFGPTLPTIGVDDIGKAIVVSNNNEYSLQSLEFLNNKGDSSDNDYSFRTVTVNELKINDNTKIKLKEDKLSVANTNDEYVTLSGASPENENDFTTQEYVKEKYAPTIAAIRPTANGNPAVCENSVAWDLQGLKVFGKSVQDGTPSPENPVPIVSAGEGGSVELAVTGANLANPSGANPSPEFTNGVTVVNNNGVISVTGTPTNTSGSVFTYYFTGEMKLPKGYYFTKDCNVRVSKDGSVVDYIQPNKTFFFNPDIADTVRCYIQRVPQGFEGDGITYVDGEIVYPALFAGYTTKPWVPYTGQSLPLSTPSGLPGIPVDSGGNYVDANGQQRICDVVDLIANVSTQNILQVHFDGNESWSLQSINEYGIANFSTVLKGVSENSVIVRMISNRFVGQKNIIADTQSPGILISGATLYIRMQSQVVSDVDGLKAWLSANPTDVLVPLVTPIVTPLSDEEIAAYRALQTYEGTTVVSTSEDIAGIEAQYLADGTKYIESVQNEINTTNETMDIMLGVNN